MGQTGRELESNEVSIVLIEENDADAELVLGELVAAGLRLKVARATNTAEVRAALTKGDGVDAVLCAYSSTGVKVWEALEIMQASVAAAPLIVVSRGLSDEQAAECMRLGAIDYILKDRLGRLPHALTQAIHHARAERASHEVERGYRRLFENLPMAVFRATSEGQILHANPAAVDMFGFADLESLVATSVVDLYVDPDDWKALLARLQTDKHMPDFECLMRRADGTEFWFSRVVHAAREEDGRVVVWETIGRDVTERREAMLRLRESQAYLSTAELELAESDGRLRSLLAGAPIAVTTLDRDGHFTFVGGSVFSQVGVDPSSPFGLLATEAFGDRPDLLEFWTSGLERDLLTDLEFGGRTFHVHGGPLRLSPDGEVIGVRAVALDITERVEAERRLSRRVAQQEILLELSRAGLEGRETSDFLATAVELVARGSETEFGTISELAPADDCLIPVAAYGHSEGIPPDRAPIDASSQDTLKSETPVVADYEAEPAPTRSPWMIECGVVTSMAVGIVGPVSPFGLLSVHSSVEREFSSDDLQFIHLASTIISVAVERKRAEKQRRMLLSRLVTAQEAERKTIADDIHDDAVQIMTAANMRLELFRMVLTDPAQVDAAQKLQETISLAIGRLRNLLFDLIPPDLDLHGLAAAFRRHLEQSEAHGGVAWELQAELDEEPAPQVRILLFRIFQEALMNVRKHARATTVTASLKTVDGGVMMRLSDDGAGFHPAVAEPLAGHLGLASMRERAEIAGGWWRLTTEPGGGTEVTTWVPAPRDGVSSAALARL
jgi:PAS domain S-box-containing protein